MNPTPKGGAWGASFQARMISLSLGLCIAISQTTLSPEYYRYQPWENFLFGNSFTTI